MKKELLIKSAKLYNGKITNILIADGKIEDITSQNDDSIKNLDAKNHLLLPGLIDPHVHVRGLKQSYKEDWISLSKAAISSGNTFIFDMPNTLPPTNNLKNFELKLKEASKGLINYKLNISATNDNENDLKEILKKHYEKVGAIKVFLASSSSNEVTNPKNLSKIFNIAKEYDKVVIVHTELQDCIEKFKKEISAKMDNHHLIRNKECALQGLKIVLDTAKKVKNKVYIAHVSTKEEVEILKREKSDIIFAEVTPHHLLLNYQDVKSKGIITKVNPPVRTKEDNIALLQALKEGIIDVIATDHAPHSIKEKFQNYAKSPSGFGGLETKLPLLLTLVKQNKLTLAEIIKATSENPAKIFGLKKRGKVAVGNFADMVIIDENVKYSIEPKKFYSKSKYSPFEGWEVFGKVVCTIVNGKIYEVEKDLKTEDKC